MRIKYNRVSTLQQSGDRFSVDTDNYDLVLMDKVSGTISFKDRPSGQELTKLVEEGKVTELIIEEFSRLGRNTGDCLKTLEWLEGKNVNVVVRNLGIQSRPNGNKNPIWKLMSAVMSSMYELELENIKERTMVGRQVYVQKGGLLGRPKGSHQPESEFLKKGMSQSVIKSIEKGLTVRETSKVNGVSTRTVMKVKKIAAKHGVLS